MLELFRFDEWLLVVPLALAAVVMVTRRAPRYALGAAAWLLLVCGELLAVWWIGKMGIRAYINGTVHRVTDPVVLAAAVMLPVLLAAGLESRRQDAGTRDRELPRPTGARPRTGESSHREASPSLPLD